MTNTQVIAKVNKKAWQQIKIIKSATNMLSIEAAIGEAVLKTFGLYNTGLIKISMRNGYTDMLKIYGAEKYRGDYDKMMRVREADFNEWHWLARNYLVEMIPVRFHKSLMYQKLIGQFPQNFKA